MFENRTFDLAGDETTTAGVLRSSVGSADWYARPHEENEAKTTADLLFDWPCFVSFHFFILTEVQ